MPHYPLLSSALGAMPAIALSHPSLSAFHLFSVPFALSCTLLRTAVPHLLLVLLGACLPTILLSASSLYQ